MGKQKEYRSMGGIEYYGILDRIAQYQLKWSDLLN